MAQLAASAQCKCGSTSTVLIVTGKHNVPGGSVPLQFPAFQAGYRGLRKADISLDRMKKATLTRFYNGRIRLSCVCPPSPIGDGKPCGHVRNRHGSGLFRLFRFEDGFYANRYGEVVQ